jgi:hypothetical protein
MPGFATWFNPLRMAMMDGRMVFFAVDTITVYGNDDLEA